MLAITDASAGADPLGYVISVTNDVVTVRSEQDGAERDYNTAFNTAFLQPYVGKVSNSARRRVARYFTRPQLVDSAGEAVTTGSRVKVRWPKENNKSYHGRVGKVLPEHDEWDGGAYEVHYDSDPDTAETDHVWLHPISEAADVMTLVSEAAHAARVVDDCADLLETLTDDDGSSCLEPVNDEINFLKDNTEDGVDCDDKHDPADAPVSEDDLGRIAQEAATAIAGVAHRSACMCCQRSVQDDACTTVDLSIPAPSHYAARLKVPANADLPTGLIAFYQLTGDGVHESWSSLMLCQTSVFTSHDGEPCGSLCGQCRGALKDRKSEKPPTMSIANGNWWGSASAIPELAELTESEWTFLTQGRCGTAAVRHETVVAFEHQPPISRDRADGTTVHPMRAKLTRHMVVRRATPAETLRRLQGCTAPALKVHLCVGNLRTDAEVRAAIAESKRKITINVPRVRTAHAWLVSNNAGFDDDVLGDIDVDANQVLQNVLTVTGHGKEERLLTTF